MRNKMERVRIGKLWYPVITLGYGKRIGIWLQGCTRRCPHCISPELQAEAGGEWLTVEDLEQRFSKVKEVDGLTISGGEPFDQPSGLRGIIEWFSSVYTDDILVFSGYTLQELHEKEDADIDYVLKSISVLVDGAYFIELNDGMGLRGSSNQVIHVWNNHKRYLNAETNERKMQGVLLNDQRLWMIGIPPGVPK